MIESSRLYLFIIKGLKSNIHFLVDRNKIQFINIFLPSGLGACLGFSDISKSIPNGSLYNEPYLLFHDLQTDTRLVRYHSRSHLRLVPNLHHQ